MTGYRCVDDQKAAGFAVTKACEANGLYRSGYYDWAAREAAEPTDRQVEEAHIVELMTQIWDASDGSCGVRAHVARAAPRRHRGEPQAGAPTDAPTPHGWPGLPASGHHDGAGTGRLQDPRSGRPWLQARRTRCRLVPRHRAPRGALEPCGGERTPRCARRSGRTETEGSLTRGTPGRVEAALTTTGRVGTVRRSGSGK